jgi:hypothetical protein
VSGSLEEGDPFKVVYTAISDLYNIIALRNKHEEVERSILADSRDSSRSGQVGRDGDDDSGEGTNARLIVELPQSGTYGLAISSARSGETGAYEVVIAPGNANAVSAAPVLSQTSGDPRLQEADRLDVAPSNSRARGGSAWRLIARHAATAAHGGRPRHC